MDSNRKVLCLQGDGIGPEIFTEVKRVVDWFDKNLDVGFSLEEDLVGGAAYDKHKTPLTEETLGKAHESDAILLGAVGGPKYDSLSFEVRPERALLKCLSVGEKGILTSIYASSKNGAVINHRYGENRYMNRKKKDI